MGEGKKRIPTGKFKREPSREIPYDIRHEFLHGQWVETKVYRALTEEEALDPEFGTVQATRWRSGNEW